MSKLRAVIGVGASAGGLSFLQELVRSIPSGAGVAVLIAQHIEPSHESRLADILGRETDLTVQQGEEGTGVRPNTIYTIPAGSDMIVENGNIALPAAPTSAEGRTPIDRMFRSLAAEFQEQTIGIVLSGNGADGAAGLQAVHEQGGLVLVQDPEEASYDSMPRSAINLGIADAVLNVEGMGGAVLSFLDHRENHMDDAVKEHPSDAIEPVLEAIDTHTGYQFWKYKRSTLARRIQRRMGLRRVKTVSQYVQLLAKDEEERDRLVRDLLISVTRFFRNEEAFEAFGKAVDKLLDEVAELGRKELRVWVPGASRGEEAYTIAIVILEKLRERGLAMSLHVFGTDVERRALSVARRGEYGEYIEGQVPSEILDRYFTKIENGYRVIQDVREKLMFSEQDLLSDPPFGRLDIISCRNLLIYLDRGVHDDVFSLFHFSLRDRGILFLGRSETVGNSKDLFEPFDRENRIYRRRDEASERHPAMPLLTGNYPARKEGAQSSEKSKVAESIETATLRLMAEEAGPATVAVDANNTIRYISGRADEILVFPSGEPRLELPKLLRSGLSSRVLAAVRAVRDGSSREEEVIRYRVEDVWRRVRVIARPANTERGLVVLIFEGTRKDGSESADVDVESVRDEVIQSLEKELDETRRQLQDVVEDSEASTEELKASNEEIMSMNEELQSTNEELETSKEETQSLNEELQVLNSELEEKVSELERTNRDLENLLESTDIAILLFDRDHRLTRHSEKSAQLFGLLPSDVGNHFQTLPNSFQRIFDDEDLLSRPLENVTEQKEIYIEEAGWFLLRVHPYREEKNEVGGVVVSLAEVNDLKSSQEQLERAVRRFQSLAENSKDMIMRIGPDNEVRYVNSHVLPGLPESANDIIGKTIEEIRFPHELGLDWKDAVQSVFETSRPTKKELSIEVGEDNRHFDCTFTPEEASDGSVATVLAISRDVTELVAVRRSLERALADREVLIRDVHHRVKNNLFLLSSLLYLEREKLTKLLDNPGPAVRSINTIMSRIQVISSIYTYLYESAGEADSICADSFLSGLLELIERAYPERDVDLRLSSEPLRLSVDVAVPLGLVVNEILTNVFKHAFTDTEDGSVSIELMETDGQSAVLTIADNGVGMDTEVQSDGAGIGSELVKALVEQIQGDLRVEASNGTRIRIDFRTILDGSGEEPDGDSSHS